LRSIYREVTSKIPIAFVEEEAAKA